MRKHAATGMRNRGDGKKQRNVIAKNNINSDVDDNNNEDEKISFFAMLTVALGQSAEQDIGKAGNDDIVKAKYITPWFLT